MTSVKSAIEAESPKCESYQCGEVQAELHFFLLQRGFKTPESPSQKLCFLTIFVPSFLEVVLKGSLEGNCLELKLGIMLDPEGTDSRSALRCCVFFADCRNVINAPVCTDNCQQQR